MVAETLNSALSPGETEVDAGCVRMEGAVTITCRKIITPEPPLPPLDA